MTSENLVRHVVFFQFKDTASDEDIAEVGQAFLDLPTQVSEIHDLEWGSAINEGAPYTHCLMVVCRNTADLSAYEGHPAHQAIATTYGHLIAGVIVLDYWTN
jgi:hypothetical protein